MKEAVLSNSERAFVIEAIKKATRVDGRELDESRKLQIQFGKDYGCCQVSLGETKVLAQVSCEVGQPGATRPNEGLLYINVEFSPMGSPYFEIGRQSELSVVINRILEKCIKDSRCLDLEGLCIVSAEKVWSVRVDINVLNHEGNLIDAASVAALAALSHFRRPDVTTTGEQIIIHDFSERDPVPLGLHHYPVCVTYGIFNNGNNIIADPTALEEKVADGILVFGINAYRELCALHLGATVKPQVTLTCANRAAKHAAIIVAEMKAALAQDAEARAQEKPVGFVESIREKTFVAPAHERWSVSLSSNGIRKEKNRRMPKVSTDVESMEIDDEGDKNVTPLPLQNKKEVITAEVPDQSSFNSSDEEESDSSDIEVIAEVTPEQRWKAAEQIELSDGSEEDDTMTLQL